VAIPLIISALPKEKFTKLLHYQSFYDILSPMSKRMDPRNQYRPKRNRTLAEKPIFIDRRAYGPDVDALCADLGRVASHFRGIELNVPNTRKEPSFLLVRSSDIKANDDLIGTIKRRDALVEIATAVPGLLEPIEDVKLGLTDRSRDFVTEARFLSKQLAPASEQRGQVDVDLRLRSEKAQAWATIAELAGVKITDLDISDTEMDMRFVFAAGVIPLSIVKDMFNVLGHYQGMSVDLVPALTPKKG
jgi:hypothetical protein